VLSLYALHRLWKALGGVVDDWDEDFGGIVSRERDVACGTTTGWSQV